MRPVCRPEWVQTWPGRPETRGFHYSKLERRKQSRRCGWSEMGCACQQIDNLPGGISVRFGALSNSHEQIDVLFSSQKQTVEPERKDASFPALTSFRSPFSPRALWPRSDCIWCPSWTFRWLRRSLWARSLQHLPLRSDQRLLGSSLLSSLPNDRSPRLMEPLTSPLTLNCAG